MNTKPLLFLFLILLIPYLLIIGNFRLLLYDTSFYHEEFQKIGTYGRQPEADALLNNVLQFLSGKQALSPEFISTEQSHMDDVKFVINGFVLLLYALLIIYILLLWYVFRQKLLQVQQVIYAMSAGALLAIMLMLLLALALQGFDTTFSGFHYLFFSSGTWVFPESSLLIQLFPQQFFLDFTYTIVIRSMVSALFLMIVGVLTYIYFNSYVQKSHS